MSPPWAAHRTKAGFILFNAKRGLPFLALNRQISNNVRLAPNQVFDSSL